MRAAGRCDVWIIESEFAHVSKHNKCLLPKWPLVPAVPHSTLTIRAATSWQASGMWPACRLLLLCFTGAGLFHACRGVDPTPVVASGPPKSITVEDSFKACSTWQGVAQVLQVGTMQGL